MSLQGQVAVADSGINLLQTFQNALSLCGSDGVGPVVLTFLDAFGARFAVAPRLCIKVRDTCTQEHSTVLGKLKIAVGYRKGDASAVLASSSGWLSSIAFIVVAPEMFTPVDIAWVITEGRHSL